VKSIMYGILDARQAAKEALPPGLSQAPLMAVKHGNLAAAISPVAEELASSAGIEQALEYARVVEQLHRRLAVLPMRYGCFVHHPEQVVEFLHRYEQQFSDALAQVEGCDEMGLRILFQESDVAEPPEQTGAPTGADAQTRGRAYLDNRRRFYAQQTRVDRAARRMAERAQAAFSGLFVRCTWDHAARPDGQLLSMAFLVERPKLAEFRRAFLRFQKDGPGKVMCSGPWPPYGFVADLAKPAIAALAELEHLQEKG